MPGREPALQPFQRRERLTQAVRVALQPARAPHRVPEFRDHRGARGIVRCHDRRLEGRHARRPLALDRTSSATRRPSTRSLEQGVARQAIRAVQAGARRLAAGPQPRDRRPPARVGRDAAHVVVRGRRDRHAGRRADRWSAAGTPRTPSGTCPAARRRVRWRPATRVRRPGVGGTARGPRHPGARVRREGPRRRGSGAPRSSTTRAPAPRSASVISGIGSTPTSSAVGWNCTISRSAQPRAGPGGHRDPVSGRFCRIRRVREQVPDAAGRDDDGRGDVQRQAPSASRHQRPATRPRTSARSTARWRLEHRHVGASAAPRPTACARSRRRWRPGHGRCARGSARLRGRARGCPPASRSKAAPMSDQPLHDAGRGVRR